MSKEKLSANFALIASAGHLQDAFETCGVCLMVIFQDEVI